MMTPLQKSPTILPYLFAFLLSLSSTVTAAPPSEITINTRIVAATVYSDRAMITRSGKVALAPGMRSLVIRGLPSLVQDQSVRVTASGIVGSKIIEVQVNRMYLDTLITARTRPLLQKSRNLSFEIRKINDRLSVLKHRNDFLEKITIASQESIGRELKTARPAVDEYGKLLDFFDVELSSLKTETRSLEDQRLEHQQTFERIQKELQLIGGSPEKSEKEVTVILNAGIAGTVTIDVSYLVSQASWKPAYDIRASSSDTVVNLTYSAFVQQNTGEDWSDAVVTLTTSRPASGGNPPELDPWFIGAADRAISTVEGVVRDGSTGEPLPGASVTLIGYSTIASTDANGFYRITNIRPGALNLRATAIGFTPVRSTVVTRPFSLAKLDFALPESSVETNEVVVTGDRPRVDKSMTYAVSASEKAISSVVIEPIAVAPQTATVSATVTAASFEIPGKTTIPSDNLEHRVTI
ncbi:MAG: mucoidy inhibitor MuiA family protein, partial [Bacteroidetes bacterium]|nr:mucoidy inhibitor MuiA family protein [Bacteroidota bacterium]